VTLRIVQLSDLHLGPRLGDKRWTALERLLADLTALTGGFDRLVLTGDIAARGQPAVYTALRTRLAPWFAKVRIVPGNHDNGPGLREVFADRMLDGAPAANFLEDLEGVRLVGLDSSRPWRVSGTLGRTQLKWLSGVLDGATASLVFLHHPPLRVGTWWLDKDRLRDRNAFVEVLQNHGVLGVFCGHVHQEFEGRAATVPVWTAPSTAYQFKPGSLIPRIEPKVAGFRVIEIANGVVSTSIIRSGP
jgi:3',5'-cyclic-AMP phosphodiesterase